MTLSEHFSLDDFVNRTMPDLSGPAELSSAFLTTQVTFGVVLSDTTHKALHERAWTLFVIFVKHRAAFCAADLDWVDWFLLFSHGR
jgi:hypothetical protein